MNLTATETRQPRGKKQETRDKILEAAQQVFAAYPYDAAGIRIISKLAGVDHPLIKYYFGSKADLFREVIRHMMARRRELEKDWYAAVKPMSPGRGFSLFLDFVLEDFRKRPGLFHLVSLNFRQVDPDNPIPGFDLIEAFIKTEIDRMKANLGMEIPGHEAEAFMRVFNTLMIGFLGGAHTHARMLGMEPESIVYFNWVKESILFALLPRFKLMVRQSSSTQKRGDR
jgi:AcrR family transcriptional regulator